MTHIYVKVEDPKSTMITYIKYQMNISPVLYNSIYQMNLLYKTGDKYRSSCNIKSFYDFHTDKIQEGRTPDAELQWLVIECIFKFRKCKIEV